MRVFQHWALGTATTKDGLLIQLWRGSNHSLEDAQNLAQAEAEKVAATTTADTLSNRSQYSYQTRFIPEEIISTFPGPNGNLLAAVTRNRYGALVLNTADVVFIDADIPSAGRQAPSDPASSSGIFGWLFGNKTTATTANDPPPEDLRLQQICLAASEFPELAFRVYRTKAGFRIVLLNRRLPPQDPLVQRLMTAFRADPDYQQLCKFQQSYRARLTPKPTYLKMAHPPFRYPESATWGRPSVEQWEREYESKSQGFRVCQPIQDIGPHGIDPEVEFLLGLHDQSCRASVDLPLA